MQPKKLTETQLAEFEEQVVKLQDALQSWRDAGLPEKTLLVLLSHSTKVPQRTIKAVLDGLDSLYEDYFTYNDD